MPTDFFERLDTLSQESREKLNEQIERVQEEARKLRAQARRLRRAQKAETKQRKRLMEQVTQSGKAWSQSAMQRGGELTAAAGSQLKSGQQMLLERSGNLVQGMGQRGSQASQNLTDWRDGTTQRLRKQGQNVSDWSGETTHQVRRQGQQLAQGAADWKDETTHQLRKQGQHLAQNVSDWGDETAYRLRKQGQHLVHDLGERREEVTRKLRKQGRTVSRNIVEQKNDAAHKLRKQGRSLSRNVTARKEDVTRQLRKQSQALSRRSEQLLKPARKRGVTIWSTLGFLAGLLLAGGATYWLVRRNLNRRVVEEEQIELPRETLNGAGGRPAGEIRYTSQGGTAVVTRPGTETINKFVGVLSTRQYYPIEQQPEVHDLDLVYFENETDAMSEGFTAAD